MKKFTLSILAVLMTAFVMTSCIDNAVSPEVKAIRAAQVNLITAQIALTNANAAYLTAQAALSNSVAAQNLADADYRDAQTAGLLVQLEIDIALAEVAVAAQATLLQKEIDALAKYLATRDIVLATEAGGYLELYSAAIDDARTVALEIANQQYYIAVLEMYLASVDPLDPDDLTDGAGQTLATLRALRTADVADKEAALAAAQAALAIMEAVAVDPTTAAVLYAENQAEIQALTNENLALEIDLVPFDIALTAATTALTTPLANLNAAKATVNAINLIKAEYEDQEDDVAAKVADVAAKLAAANSASANLQAQLKPFLDALVAAYAGSAAYIGTVAGLAQDLRVASNEWKVALAQGYVIEGQGGDVEDAPTYDTALGSMEAAITGIEDLTELDYDIDVEDEETYPGFTPENADYTLTTAAMTIQPGAGDTYTQGTGASIRIYTVLSSASATSVVVNGDDGAPTNGALTRTAGAGDVTITVTATASKVVNMANDQDGEITDDEIDALVDHFLDETTGVLNPGDADPDSEYAQSGLLYDPIAAFFGGNVAGVLVDDIGQYSGTTFLSNFVRATGDLTQLTTDVGDGEDVDGNDMDPDDTGFIYKGNGANGFTAYWTAQTAQATEEAFLDAIAEGDAINDGVTGTDGDDLEDAYEEVATYADTTEGGHDDAIDVEADAIADQTAAQTAYNTANTAKTAAQTAYDVIGDVIDDNDDLLADLEDVADAFEDYFDDTDGINTLIAGFIEDVEDAQDDLDDANRRLDDVDLLETKNDEVLAAEQAYLVDLQAELAGYQAAAAAYLALLNAALGN